MAPIDIRRIILEELGSAIASRIGVDVQKLDKKLQEAGIADSNKRTLLIKQILSSNITENILMEVDSMDSKQIKDLETKIPTDPKKLADLYKFYSRRASSETKKEIEAALRKHYQTKIYKQGDADVTGGDARRVMNLQKDFRRTVGKIVGLSPEKLDSIVQFPEEEPTKQADAPKKPSTPKKDAPTKEPATKKDAPAGKASVKKDAPTKQPATKKDVPTGKPSAAKDAPSTPKPKRKRKPFVMTKKKAQNLKKRYKDFTDGDDDKQISKKFTASKQDKEAMPKFGKVGKQVKGGTKGQAASRDKAATPYKSGEKPNRQLGSKGDSVPCLRGRKMDPAAYAERERVGNTIMGGGADSGGEALPFGRGRWTQERKKKFSAGQREIADGKAIKAVLNFMGAAARFGYDPVRYWPNFLWATATDIVLKDQPKSPECGDPRNAADLQKAKASQKSRGTQEEVVHLSISEETNFDVTLPRLSEEGCGPGCTDEQLEEASKRDTKLIPKYKNTVAALRQKSKGMNLDQFLNLIKYKE